MATISVQNLGYRMKKSIGDRRRERNRRRRVRNKIILQKFGPELAAAHALIMHEPTAHSKKRMFELKRQIVESTTGIKIKKNTLERIQVLNLISGQPLLTIGWKCMACPIAHKHPEFFDTDHIIPLAEGGTNSLENFQILCPNCHRKKSRQIDGFTSSQSFKNLTQTSSAI